MLGASTRFREGVLVHVRRFTRSRVEFCPFQALLQGVEWVFLSILGASTRCRGDFFFPCSATLQDVEWGFLPCLAFLQGCKQNRVSVHVGHFYNVQSGFLSLLGASFYKAQSGGICPCWTLLQNAERAFALGHFCSSSRKGEFSERIAT